eukprot:5969240-Heterocapsa_arctica.AAC.1
MAATQRRWQEDQQDHRHGLRAATLGRTTLDRVEPVPLGPLALPRVGQDLRGPPSRVRRTRPVHERTHEPRTHQ